MTDVPASQPRYRLTMPGGGFEDIDRFALSKRIRAGEVVAATELAIAGIDAWQPAASYPELARYFELTAARPVTSGGYVAAPEPRDVEPMAHRVVQGLAYPVSGGGAVTIVLLSLLKIVPFIGFFATLASTLIMLDIIRKSADGKTKMPLVDTSSAWELLRMWLRVLCLTIIAMAPMIVVSGFAIVQMFNRAWSPAFALLAVLAAGALGAIYYPACLATVAVWDNIISAFNPAYVARVIRIMGGDYFVVVGMWFVATAVSMFTNFFWPLRFVPIVGVVFNAFLSFYVLFYASHLLGYAVYRHAPELGWE